MTTPTDTTQDDAIEIRGLRVLATIGVHPWEQAIRQTLTVSVALTVDLKVAGRSDDLAQSIDYGAVARRVHDVCGQRPYALIEAVATRVADEIIAGFAVERVTVEVQKPGAIPSADTVLVRIQRSRL